MSQGEPSGETNPADTLIFGLPAQTEVLDFCCLEHCFKWVRKPTLAKLENNSIGIRNRPGWNGFQEVIFGELSRAEDKAIKELTGLKASTFQSEDRATG